VIFHTGIIKQIFDFPRDFDRTGVVTLRRQRLFYGLVIWRMASWKGRPRTWTQMDRRASGAGDIKKRQHETASMDASRRETPWARAAMND
jgi:hypothetical protein